MCTDTLWWPDFRHLRAAAYTHIHTDGLEKVKWVITLSSFLVVCFVPLHFGHDKNTVGINEYTLHTSISTYGPNKNNVLPAHQMVSGPRGWCSGMIQLLYFPFTLPSAVNISTMWPSQWRPPQKSFSARRFASRAQHKLIFTGHVCHIFLLLTGTLVALIISLSPLLFFFCCCLLWLQHSDCSLSLLVSASYVAACTSDLSARQGVAG